jgi:hypothetical protein
MKLISSSKALSLAASAGLLLTLTGCNRDTVKVYQVETNDTVTAALPPAPAAAPAASAGAMPTTMPAGLPAPDTSSLPSLKYTLPDGWTEKALTQMRVASFSVADNGKQADVSVIPMGGMAGGNLANVNRWRGQVGLQPIDDAAVGAMTEKITIAGQDADLFDIAGTSPGSGDPERIIASVLHREDTAWFFKISGDADLVEKQKPAFIAFLKSLDFGAPVASAAPSGIDMSQLPPSHPPIDGMSPVTASAAPAADKPTWDVPAGWQEGPLAQFLVAKYLIAGTGNAKAEVNVSSLAGDGGGLAPNVNRWRAQLGLAPATDEDLAKLAAVDVNGAKATVVELSGTNQRTSTPASMVGVVLPLGGQTWFYKLMGDAGVVAQQKDALMKFVQSAKYPDAH